MRERTIASGRLEPVHWQRLPWMMLAGPILVIVWWSIAWLRLRPVSDYSFFPLWLGYILTMDGIVLLRTGTSPIARNGRRAGLMFVSSIGLWWAFELLNMALENWHYLTPRHYGPVAYALLASLSFSTVTPAVLTTAELVRSFGRDPLRRLPALRQSSWFLAGAMIVGWTMLAAVIFAPRYAFPLVWLSLIFVLDPLSTAIGGRSIGTHVERRDWSPIFNLGAAALICGWFWEMWNFYSMPKWVYTVPGVGYLHVFEMPLLGYGGYIPFGVEVFVFYQLVRVLLPWVPFPEPRVSNREGANVRGSRAIESPMRARL